MQSREQEGKCAAKGGRKEGGMWVHEWSLDEGESECESESESEGAAAAAAEMELLVRRKSLS